MLQSAKSVRNGWKTDISFTEQTASSQAGPNPVDRLESAGAEPRGAARQSRVPAFSTANYRVP